METLCVIINRFCQQKQQEKKVLVFISKLIITKLYFYLKKCCKIELETVVFLFVDCFLTVVRNAFFKLITAVFLNLFLIHGTLF